MSEVPEDTLEIPLSVTQSEKDEPMSDGTTPAAGPCHGLASELMSQSMGQLSQSGAVAQNNFLTTNKAQDFDYLEGKRVVSLEEAVGVREVTSQPPGNAKP